jgi:hypothetical protein
MRAGRMCWAPSVAIVALLVAALAAAQAEPGDGAAKLIERPYTAVLEIFMVGAEYAGEVPYSGETSDFDGLCSVPSNLVWRNRIVGLDSVFGHFEGEGSLCVQVEWGADADGAPAMVGMGWSDMVGYFGLPDGSAIDVELIVLDEAFDMDTGQLTSATAVVPSGGGTGRFESAKLYGVMNCRWFSPEALMAGVEPELCAIHGTIRYDPHAVAGE